MKERDYESAEALWTKAIETGAGSPNQLANALVQRAACRAVLRQFDKAHADLDFAPQVAPDMDAVHVVRAFVYTKEGKQSQAKSEFEKARQLNPRAEPIKE